MNKTFNKTLLAVALAGFGVSAQAATVAQTATDYSKQYVQTVAASTVVDTAFTVSLNAEYKNDDVVTIKFSSPLASGYVAPPSVIATPVPAATAVVTLGLLSQTTDTLTYRVTDVNKVAGNTTIGNLLTFTAVQFTAGTLNSVADIKATYSAQTATGGFDLDVGANNTKKVLAAADQFAAEVDTALEGLITLPNRNALAAGHVNLLATFADDTALRNFVTLDEVTWTLEGDFSWIKDTGVAAGLQPDPAVEAAFTLPGTCALDSITATEMVVKCSDDADLVVDLDAAVIAANTAAAGVPASAATAATVATTLKKTDYVLSSSVNYSGSASGDFAALTDAAAGKWRVDGVEVEIPYLVKGVVSGKEYSHIVNARNNHSSAGDVTIDVFAEDGTPIDTNVAAGSIKANEVKSLSRAINDVLGDGFNGKFSVTVFIEVPAASGSQVYSAYVDNVTKERAIVINSSN